MTIPEQDSILSRRLAMTQIAAGAAGRNTCRCASGA